jgi:uncharacterized protein
MERKTSLPSQRLELLPDVFGVARPPSREALSRWRPQHTFSFVYDTPDELSVLCPERFIPAAEACITGLRVLVLWPHGGLVVEILECIADTLRLRSVPATADCHFESDLGCITVRECDVELLVSLLRQKGHAVARRAADR